METFLLPPALADEIIAHARQAYPEEACGLVAGRDGAGVALYRGHNVSPTPTIAFELDTETLARQLEFEDQGLTLAAIYHSHPAGPETPSPVDVARAYYPDTVALICSLARPSGPVLRGFRIAGRRVREVAVVESETNEELTSAGR